MEIDEILNFALSLNDAEECSPFGPDTVVIKNKGKIFLILNLNREPISFNYKADPENIIQQREDFSAYIFPGYHMNKKHWNTLIINQKMPNPIIKDLIHTSYLLVGRKKKTTPFV